MSLDLIKQLREYTGAGFVDCQQSLKEANGDLNIAQEILRKKGQKIALKKANRAAKEGIIEAYIHSGAKVGVLLELNCETDFVAKNVEFKNLAHEIALQIAATNPSYLKPEDVPTEILEKEKEIYREQLSNEKKPAEIIEKIISGRLEKYYSENCLLKQLYIKDDSLTIENLLIESIAKIGENISIGRFTRYSL